MTASSTDHPGSRRPIPAIGGPSVLSLRRRLLAWAVVAAGLPLLTLVAAVLGGSGSLGGVLLAYVLVVVLAAVLGGTAPALVGALASFALANFVLTEPRYTFEIASREQVAELVLLVVVGALVSVTVEAGARDRAAQVARSRELAEVDRVRAAILAAVSHDLRTPLASIKGAVSALRQPDVAFGPQESAELLAAVEDGADRLDGVVGNLLAMTRIRAGALPVRIAPVLLDEVVSRALLGLGPTAPEPRTAVPEDLPVVLADPDLLERVVSNLVANALRFDPDGTTVRAEVVDDGRAVALEVVDHGPGVPAEEWPRMFAPFQRLGPEGSGGSGLGLAIAAGFCEAMDLALVPARTRGGGLTMTIRLVTA